MPELVRAVADEGYTSPTPVQTQAIPFILEGRDVLAGAQTGTGKTAGFTLPLLQRLAAHGNASPSPAKHPVRALIITPTRELAAQVEESVRTYGKHMPLRSTLVYGGVGINPQIDALRRGVDILVATPGRLLDHLQQKTVDLRHVEILVLDEADRMLDMGFIRDIKRILAVLPKRRQNLLFSATFSAEIKALADGLLNAPAMIEVARRNSTVEIISQKIHPVDRDRKRELLSHLIKTNNWHQVLVFTRTKHGANKLAEQLNHDGITALAIHGNKSQAARTRALAEFKVGRLQVLCATDIAARGIDIEDLPHVVNYDLPNVPEDYVHRIGRTGRAGNEGEAISLVCIDEKEFLRDIERLIKREIPVTVIAGCEPDPRAVAQPVFAKQQRGRGQPSGQGRRPSAGHHAPASRTPSRDRVPARGQPAGQPARRKQDAQQQPRSHATGRQDARGAAPPRGTHARGSALTTPGNRQYFKA